MMIWPGRTPALMLVFAFMVFSSVLLSSAIGALFVAPRLLGPRLSKGDANNLKGSISFKSAFDQRVVEAVFLRSSAGSCAASVSNVARSTRSPFTQVPFVDLRSPTQTSLREGWRSFASNRRVHCLRRANDEPGTGNRELPTSYERDRTRSFAGSRLPVPRSSLFEGRFLTQSHQEALFEQG